MHLNAITAQVISKRKTRKYMATRTTGHNQNTL
jgi:hypothetical protein